MGILDWFKHLAGGQDEDCAAAAPPTPTTDRGAEVGGLNFKSAVDAHMKWKVRLEGYINGTSNEDLKVETVSCDDKCPLGKWIYGEGGQRFGFSETFFEMKAHHTLFHRAAGSVLRAAQAGQKEKALQLLHQGDYVRASERVKQMLARLFVLVADGKAAIDAHVKWKARLRESIGGESGEEVDVRVVSADDQCALGQWLKGPGAERYGTLPAFRDVRANHALFHECAGKVVTTAKAGNRPQALRMLENGDYVLASEGITSAMVRLFSQERERTAS